jgi:hypothetical protein
MGVGSQAALQLVHNGDRAGLNLYARHRDAFDHSTVQLAELFASRAASVLKYAVQVEQLGEGLHSHRHRHRGRNLMEGYRIDRDQAFGFLLRNFSQRNVKVRLLARGVVIDGTFKSTSAEDNRSPNSPHDARLILTAPGYLTCNRLHLPVTHRSSLRGRPTGPDRCTSSVLGGPAASRHEDRTLSEPRRSDGSRQASPPRRPVGEGSCHWIAVRPAGA